MGLLLVICITTFHKQWLNFYCHFIIHIYRLPCIKSWVYKENKIVELYHVRILLELIVIRGNRKLLHLSKHVSRQLEFQPCASVNHNIIFRREIVLVTSLFELKATWQLTFITAETHEIYRYFKLIFSTLTIPRWNFLWRIYRVFMYLLVCFWNALLFMKISSYILLFTAEKKITVDMRN